MLKDAKKKTITPEVFGQFVQRITSCDTLDELAEIGKDLILYDVNGYKRAAIMMYKTRKAEIMQELVQNNKVFSALYFLLKLTEGNALKQVGKLIYGLMDKGVLTKGEINCLFDLYEKRKSKDEHVEEEVIEEE